MTGLLKVAGLDAFYGSMQVLDDVSLIVPAGETVAVLGANGAGKTTLLKALSRMVRTRGSIVWAGVDLDRQTTESVARLGVAHVPEGRGTFNRVSTEENLILGAYCRRDRKAIAEDLDRVYRYFPPLVARRRQQAGTLSGGEQQMLAIGRALMLRPRLMLLDEPSFGLAPLIVQELFEILGDIRRRESVSMLLVEQNAGLALEFVERAYVLETGRVVLSGTALEVAADESVRRSYLGF